VPFWCFDVAAQYFEEILLDLEKEKKKKKKEKEKQIKHIDAGSE